jgi:hypothetical protein
MKRCNVFFLLLLLVASVLEGHQIRISATQAKRMGEKIWQNESGQSIAGLTTWNEGEEFASVGIGHFIWFPQSATTPPFKETFPELVAFFQKNQVPLPDWLTPKQACPWNERQAFYQAFESEKMEDLRELLENTVDLQIYFMVERLKRSLPLLLANLDQADQKKIRFQFQRLCQSSAGLYALLDYINFKGEGVLETESYHGEGWGLRHVLLQMKGKGPGAVAEFAQCAKAILAKRVQNAPSHRNEERWLKGWYNRLDTYPAFS